MQVLADKIPTLATAQIDHPMGLSARAAVIMANAANRYRCRISISCDGRKVDGRSIMDLILLNAKRRDRITIETQGEDSERALEALSKLIEDDFGL